MDEKENRLKQRSFHLSIGVDSMEESVNFFEDILKSEVVHRDPSGYVNVDFFGSQITLKEAPGIVAQLKDLHFGVNLSIKEFESFTGSILATKYAGVVSKPVVVDEGSPMERRKMYLKCPTGYLFEIKGYAQAT